MVVIKAPHPNPKVTTILPSPLFEDTRSSESTLQIKKTMTGRTVTYVQSSERVVLRLPFKLYRMKALELDAFIASYQSAEWHVTLHDGSQWAATLVGQPYVRTATDRAGNSVTTGKELIETILTLSAKRLN